MPDTSAPYPEPGVGQSRLFSKDEMRQALLAGCGFALAFGWVWSGALRDLWLAEALTGTLFSGQGTTVFFATLLAVFLAGGVIGSIGGSVGASMRWSRRPAWLFPFLAHGAAVLPLCASVFIPGEAGRIAVAASLGLAGGLAGLYWGSVLLRLTPAAAGLALAVAGLLITGLAALTEAVSPASQSWPFLAVPVICAGIALLLAWPLAVRPKGETGDRQTDASPARPPWKTAVALALSIGVLGALFSAEGYAAPAPWLQAGLEATGTLSALALCLVLQKHGFFRERPPLFSALALPLASSLAMLPLALLWPAAFSWALHFATGALLAVAVMQLAGRCPAGHGAASSSIGSSGLAGYALAALPVALNAGFYAGSRAALLWSRANTGLAALVFLCLVVLFWLARPARERAEREGGAPATVFHGMRAAMTSMLRTLPPLTRQEVRRACVTGLGFALAMGWIWFPGMQILCPPLLRTVAPPLGEGAMLFLATLSLGYPLLGLGAGIISGRLSPHLLHAATLPFVFILLYQAVPSPYFTLLFALLAGLASVCAGLYWLAVMFAHRPACAGLSFVVSGFAAAGISLAATYLPPDSLRYFLPLLIASAWPLALLRPESPPREKRLGAASPSGMPDIWFLIPALFLMGFLEKLLLAGNGPSGPALLCLCSALGGAAGLLLTQTTPAMRGWKSVCLALLLPIPGLMAGWGAAFSQAATGMVSALTVMELSVYFDRIRTNRVIATGVAAGGIAMLFNLGYAVGDGVIAAMPETELVTVLVCLVVSGVAAFLGTALARRQPGPGTEFVPPSVPAGGQAVYTTPSGYAANPENAGPAPNEPEAPDSAESGLTATEQRIADLLRQGHTNAAISDEMGIALTTTRVHLRSIHKKMATSSREELVERLREMAGE